MKKQDEIKTICKASLGRILKIGGVGLQGQAFHRFKQLVCDEVHKNLVPSLTEIVNRKYTHSGESTYQKDLVSNGE